MRTIIKYVLLDLLRNKTILVYTFIMAVLAVSVLGMSGNSVKGLLSLLNITLLFVPIISILFTTIYLFNSVEFTELLLAHPIKRRAILMAEFLGITLALTMAYLVGIGLPVLLFNYSFASATLLISGLLLTLIFSALALLIFVLFKDKTKGIGAAIITALFFTLLFDGLLLSFIYSFSDYPIDKLLLGIISLNPVDLGRILVLLRLDVAVMMGYSGALFKAFMGSIIGSLYSVACMALWVLVPLLFAARKFNSKDL